MRPGGLYRPLPRRVLPLPGVSLCGAHEIIGEDHRLQPLRRGGNDLPAAIDSRSPLATGPAREGTAEEEVPVAHDGECRAAPQQLQGINLPGGEDDGDVFPVAGELDGDETPRYFHLDAAGAGIRLQRHADRRGRQRRPVWLQRQRAIVGISLQVFGKKSRQCRLHHNRRQRQHQQQRGKSDQVPGTFHAGDLHIQAEMWASGSVTTFPK